jgi:ribosomal protein L34E
MKAQLEKEDDMYVVCAKTGIDLLSVIDSKRRIIHSHGQCGDCGLYFSIESLRTGNKSPDRWPIVYDGYLCHKCYNKPID